MNVFANEGESFFKNSSSIKKTTFGFFNRWLKKDDIT